MHKLDFIPGGTYAENMWEGKRKMGCEQRRNNLVVTLIHCGFPYKTTDLFWSPAPHMCILFRLVPMLGGHLVVHCPPPCPVFCKEEDESWMKPHTLQCGQPREQDCGTNHKECLDHHEDSALPPDQAACQDKKDQGRRIVT